jgi:hypothetical protein
MSDFKIYEDKELNIIADPINLGKLKAGETKQYKFYLYNSSINPYEEIKLNVEHEEITVISAPTELKEKSSKEFILEWKATVDVKQNLKPTLEIEGYKLLPL